jgi:hypothetical protein
MGDVSLSAGGAGARFAEISFVADGDGTPANPFPTTDNRAVPRRRALLSALIVDSELNGVVTCRVDNVSESGARLNAPGSLLLPTTFWLIVQKAAVAYEAKTVWRRFPAAGVSLGPPVDLTSPTTETARRLRKFWASVAG